MKETDRHARWNATPYFADAICDVCLSTDRVKIGSIPVVLADGRPRPDMKRIWSLCDSCHRLGSGLVSDVSIDGILVYLSVRVVDGDVVQNFVFAPLMFRDRLC